MTPELVKKLYKKI